MHQCFDAVTTHLAKVMQLQGHGLAVGCKILPLQVWDPEGAIRTRANRLKV